MLERNIIITIITIVVGVFRSRATGTGQRLREQWRDYIVRV